MNNTLTTSYFEILLIELYRSSPPEHNFFFSNVDF